MSVCSRCGADFPCGMVDNATAQPCWCTTLPLISPAALATLSQGDTTASCFCPACLRAAVADTSTNND